MKVLILKGGDGGPVGEDPGAAAGSRLPAAVVVGDDQQGWVVLNLSPAVADQLVRDVHLLDYPGLSRPQARSVVLTDVQVDNVSGLLGLRDGPPVHLYATPAVYEELSHALPVLPVLQHYCGVHWHVIPVAGECLSADFQVDGLPGLEFTAVATQSSLAPHLARPGGPKVGDSIAITVRDRSSDQRLFCSPELLSAGPNALAWLERADCVLVGDPAPPSTLDALAATEILSSSGRRARPRDADEPLGLRGVARSLVDLLAEMPARRKVLLGGQSAASGRALATSEEPWWQRHGIELAGDRMVIEL